MWAMSLSKELVQEFARILLGNQVDTEPLNILVNISSFPKTRKLIIMILIYRQHLNDNNLI